MKSTRVFCMSFWDITNPKSAMGKPINQFLDKVEDADQSGKEKKRPRCDRCGTIFAGRRERNAHTGTMCLKVQNRKEKEEKKKLAKAKNSKVQK